MREPKLAILVILRFPVWAIPLAFAAMALFRVPLLFNKKVSFWRLMGSGKNGTFDTVPDLRQWAILLVANDHANPMDPVAEGVRKLLGKFITGYLNVCRAAMHGYLLQPIEGHGLWNGKAVFGDLPRKTDYDGRLAIMTRATIRLNKLGEFWRNVPAVAHTMVSAPGYEKSYGVGEIPWIKQATFSIWSSRQAMTDFAYRQHEHREVIRKTYDNNWYSEDMFTRFVVLSEF